MTDGAGLKVRAYKINGKLELGGNVYFRIPRVLREDCWQLLRTLQSDSKVEAQGSGPKS